MKTSILAFFVFSTALSACSYLGPSDPTTLKDITNLDKASAQNDPLTFATASKWVLAPKCIACHRQSHEYLRTAGGVASRRADIIDEVFIEKSMPTDGVKLSECEAEILKEYLDKGDQSDKTVSELASCTLAIPAPTPSPTPAPTPEPSPEPTPEASPTPVEETLASLTFATLSNVVLQPKCISCHKHAVGFLLTAEGVKKNSDDIFTEVFITETMPPKKKGPLNSCQLEILKEWLDKGDQPDKTVGDLPACKAFAHK